MSFKIKNAITLQLINLLNIKHLPKNKLTLFEFHKGKNEPEFHLPLNYLKYVVNKDKNTNNNNTVDSINLINLLDHKKYSDECFINEIQLNNQNNDRYAKIIFKLKTEPFIKNVLEKNDINLMLSNDTDTMITGINNAEEKSSKILVEFSSPNIAKPFHVGHLRSTIIGNFISNLYQSINNQRNNVMRMNYLGDWGTQFGYLQIGLDAIGDQEMEQNPIKHLFNAYVYANQLGKNDETIAKRARDIFYQLEVMMDADAGGGGAQHSENLNKWEKYREYTINELTKIYNRLGVKFDKYYWESQYNKNAIGWCLDLMKSKGILCDTADGQQQIIKINDAATTTTAGKAKEITLIKNDGTTLYLTRDIASLIDRYNQFKFNKLLYIVDNSQHEHFQNLFEIGKQLELSYIDTVEHIKFGRIKGMSTRKGNVIFLNDILDEAKEIMLKKQMESSTTKVNIISDDNNTADILGISAVIINDLKQRRTRDYDFDWDKALQANGDTGIKLQYTHCRLCSLEETINIEMADICEPKYIMEPEAQTLIYEIAKFQEIICKTEENLEACILVNYLFSLCNAISKALKILNIKNHSNVMVQQQRLLLFNTARKVLHKGMMILGLQPLRRM